MADEPVVVRGINWKETFPFTLIFRSFRIAIHPSKLVLALLALLSIYVGGRILDAIWLQKHSAVLKEVDLYQQAWMNADDPSAEFRRMRDEQRKEVVERYNARLKQLEKPDGDLDDIEYALKDRRNRLRREAIELYDKADKSTPEKSAAAARLRDSRIREVYDRAYAEYEDYRLVEGVGLFKTFYEYQLSQINIIVRGARNGDWLGPQGVFAGLTNFFTVGPAWAIKHHPFYFILFGLFFLMVWAIFGGAISRIAAVHVARDEKISIRQALAFSSSKFLSFISAPIIPLLIVLVVGLVVAIGGLLGNIPFLGPIFVGAMFFLALAAGFVMTLVMLGLAGGFNLMYPTIAVEGSDSFDAISRSFSYLYARPWRLAFYTGIAIVYGALTYTFVRFFIYLLLYLTHTFVGLLFLSSADSTAPLWPTMWPNPWTYGRLAYDIDFMTLSGGQAIGAALLAFWVYLTVGMLGAFAISFYFSANTIIYYLMRHEVDATELDDVYLEQSEEEFAEAAPPASAGAPPGQGSDAETGSPSGPPADTRESPQGASPE
jgi:hypothetical protein